MEHFPFHHKHSHIHQGEEKGKSIDIDKRMPPKVKSKGPAVSTAQFAFNQRNGPPAPAPLPPHRRGDTTKALLFIPGSSHAMVALYSVDTKLKARRVVKELVASHANDDNENDVPIVIQDVDVSTIVVTQISACDGNSAALVATEKHGLIIINYLGDEVASSNNHNGPKDYRDAPKETQNGSVKISSEELQLVGRNASSLLGSPMTPFHQVMSCACSSRHGLAVVVDYDLGAVNPNTKVVGWGFTDMQALGTPSPILTTIHSTEGLGRVPRPKQPLHEGAVPVPYLPFAWLPEFSAHCPSRVFAGRHLSFFVSNGGVYACGALSPKHIFETPTQVWAESRAQILNIVVLNREAFALARGNRVLRLRSPEHPSFDAQDDGRNSLNFVDVTDELFRLTPPPQPIVEELHPAVAEHPHDDVVGSASPSNMGTPRKHEETPRSGKAVAVPNRPPPPTSLLPVGSQLTRISGGAEHVVVVDSIGGGVFGWGSNTFGQLGYPSTAFLASTKAVALPVREDFSSVHAVGMRTIVLGEYKEQLQVFGCGTN